MIKYSLMMNTVHACRSFEDLGDVVIGFEQCFRLPKWHLVFFGEVLYNACSLSIRNDCVS